MRPTRPALLALALTGGLVTATPAHAAPPVLTDTAPAAGLAATERTWAASPVDADLDGQQDVWVGYHQRADGVLYRARPDGTYAPSSPELTPRVNTQGGVFDRHACAWADYDGNGLPDAYCSGGRNESNYVKDDPRDNELWLQQTDGTFLDRGTEWSVGDPCGRGRYVTTGDWNGDGLPDLFVGNQAPRPASQLEGPDACQDPTSGLPNVQSKVFLNTGGGFTYAPGYGTTRPSIGTRCAVTLDVDGDGRDDLLACHFAANTPTLYRNTGAGFEDVTKVNGLTAAVSDAAVGDVDGDGRPDVVTAEPAGVVLRLNVGGKLGPPKTIIATPAGGTMRAVTVADLNGDGRPDLFGMVDAPDSNPDDLAAIRTAAGWWTRVTAPRADGRADALATLRGSDGRDRVVVLNGRLSTAGTTQLVGIAP